MKTTVAALLCVLGLTSATGCTINATALTPAPNVLAGDQFPGTVTAEVTGVTDEKLCSHTDGLKDFCVTEFKTALTTGLSDTLPSFFSGNGEPHTASFKLVEFSHEYASAGGEGVAVAVRLAMKWQFVLRATSGKVVFQTTGRTVGPKPLVNTGQADDATKALMSAVIEEIAAGLNKAELSAPPPVEGEAPEEDGDDAAE